jgi:hypothetical protein
MSAPAHAFKRHDQAISDSFFVTFMLRAQFPPSVYRKDNQVLHSSQFGGAAKPSITMQGAAPPQIIPHNPSIRRVVWFLVGASFVVGDGIGYPGNEGASSFQHSPGVTRKK